MQNKRQSFSARCEMVKILKFSGLGKKASEQA